LEKKLVGNPGVNILPLVIETPDGGALALDASHHLQVLSFEQYHGLISNYQTMDSLLAEKDKE